MSKPAADADGAPRDVVAGEATEVALGVRRLVAPNPSPMTASGTNTYLVGARAVAVIDPGPDAPAHRDAILAAASAGGGRVAAIVVTHAHIDHTAGVPALAAATGAPVYAFGRAGDGRSETMRRLATEALGGGEGSDPRHDPSHRLGDGDAVDAGADDDWRLVALHTPGHTSDHLSFALEDGDVLFSGDLVMGWSTSVVSPPDGDMGAFMRSLKRLSTRDDQRYLPGHGEAIADPQARLRDLIAHRRMRERQILDALSDGAAAPATLVARLYAEIDPRLHGMAARNVLAHLIDLWERGRVSPVDPFASTARFERR